MTLTQDRVGQQSISNKQHLTMTIIAYRSAEDMDIIFENGHIKRHVRYNAFIKGEVQDLYFVSERHGGYMGEGPFTKRSGPYSIWSGIMTRCYATRERERSYIGCSVCEEWHCYQNFAEWYTSEYYSVDNEKMNVDKDLLFHNNKEYSPSKCLIVPHIINSCIISPHNKVSGLPIGVIKRPYSYEAKLKWSGKYVFLGNYKTPEEAFIAYKTEKERRLKMLADMYKEKIPEKVYRALYEYQIFETD